MKRFSIVVPVYHNEKNLPRTIPRLLQLKEKLPNYELELIFVDSINPVGTTTIGSSIPIFAKRFS